ncbi:S8 family serine peptidase [Streptomyces sp. KS 21]|uniref:S8 family serine peptidase n=1 Tax=Streptomyces sp. KS 21 TaxID=2485150 RepID=UPI0010EBF9B4|nr:S8 family serine peptidase [Streptomyces sp. KS 21]TDU75275.1 PA domain-containing protein [Streptomyces sp. KS 21]
MGATAAWAAGYDGKGTKVAVLDTGTDLEHPDLKGRVAASKNFTDSDTDADRQGHGTHTISTVGGSGAESGGARKGVAPGTELLSGKVLNDEVGSAPLVDAGSGTPQELAAAGAKGAIVLVKAADGALYEVADHAKAAGAKAVLAHRDAPGRWVGFTGYAGGSLPALTIEQPEAEALLARLAAGKVTLNWKGSAKSPYVYNLAQVEKGAVQGDRTYRVRDRDLGSAESTYHSMGVAADFVDLAGAYRPLGNAVYFGGLDTVAVPGKRTEFYSCGDTAWDHLVSSSFPWGEFMTDRQRTYAEGGKRSESWYDGSSARSPAATSRAGRSWPPNGRAT